MTDFELIEQAIADQERELQKLESEILDKRQVLDRQRQALSLLQPLLISVLSESKKVSVLEPDSVESHPLHKYGKPFQSWNKVHDI